MKFNDLTYLSLEESLVFVNESLQKANIEKKITTENFKKLIEQYHIMGIQEDYEWYCSKCDLNYLVNTLTNEEMYQNIKYLGALGLDFNKYDFTGRILDIGGGGEGIIGQFKGDSVVSIDLNKDELEEAPSSGLKIIMDASELKFLDNSFDTVTSFFTLMYIPNNLHQKVFGEIYRVLQPGGEFTLWDLTIPKQMDDKKLVVSFLEITLPEKQIFTGYGIECENKEQDINYYLNLAEEIGFKLVTQHKINESGYYIKFQK